MKMEDLYLEEIIYLMNKFNKSKFVYESIVATLELKKNKKISGIIEHELNFDTSHLFDPILKILNLILKELCPNYKWLDVLSKLDQNLDILDDFDISSGKNFLEKDQNCINKFQMGFVQFIAYLASFLFRNDIKNMEIYDLYTAYHNKLCKNVIFEYNYKNIMKKIMET